MAGPHVCLVCGRGFEPHGRGRHVYCRRCSGRADRSIGGTIRAQCKECGSAFAAARSTACFCSDACRLEGKRRRIREHNRRQMADPRHRAMAAARARASYARRRGGAAGEKERDRQAADGGAGRASNGAPPRPAACRMCGRGFEPHGRGRHVYCKRCRDKADRDAATVPSLKCRECGGAFAPAARQLRYCSDECRAAGTRRIDLERYRRRMADPAERAKVAARARAWQAAKKGRGM